ncbi:MAG: type II toxin-antitoxin system death-on-curing family toxin [Candidatus Tumulicola sp.]
MQNNFNWIDQATVLAIHDAQIAEHGGNPGVRDLGLLESALARPQNAAGYSEMDIPDLAALYALGVIQNHPFVDGNKRVGIVLLDLFLEDNGYELVTDDATLVKVALAVAAGEMSDEEFKAWVRACAVAL